MSLLNQVLQDLDDREQPQVRQPVRLAAAPEAVVYADGPDKIDERNWVRIGAWSVLGVAVMLAAWVFHDTDRGAREPGVPTPSAAEVAVAGKESPVSEPAKTVSLPRDVPAPAADPVPAVIATPAKMSSVLPGTIPATQAEPADEADVVMVEAAPVSATGTDGDAKNGESARMAAVAEDHYLPLRNAEMPEMEEGRPEKAHHKASTSVSVKTAKESVPQPLEQIRQAIEEGELATAEHLLQQRLGVAPNDLEARELLIGLMLRGQRYDSARQQLGLALSQHPGHGNFVLVNARMLAQDGEIDAAISFLEGVPVVSKGRVERLQMLGALYQQRSRYEEALESYRALLALIPESGSAWVGLAISLDGLGNEDALDAYKRALQLGGLPAAAGHYARQRIGQMEPNGG